MPAFLVFRLGGGGAGTLIALPRALSSAVERLVYTEDAGGSNPSAPIPAFSFILLAPELPAIHGEAFGMPSVGLSFPDHINHGYAIFVR